MLYQITSHWRTILSALILIAVGWIRLDQGCVCTQRRRQIGWRRAAADSAGSSGR